MAMVRRPLWLPWAMLPWWAVTGVGVFLLEAAARIEGIVSAWRVSWLWAVASAAAAALYAAGRIAFNGDDGTVLWRARRVPEPAEPPSDHRLAWPRRGDAPMRVSSSYTRGITRRNPAAPVDRGKTRVGLVVGGFFSLMLTLFSLPALPLALAMAALFLAVLWTALAEKAARLNQDS